MASWKVLSLKTLPDQVKNWLEASLGSLRLGSPASVIKTEHTEPQR